jgi:hypothetical protein
LPRDSRRVPAGASEPDPRDLAWEALAQELGPAKTLARIDATTARVVTNVTVVGTLLTGLGLLAASLPTTSGTARGLAVAAVVTAVAAAGCALAAQILTITKGLNTNDLVRVKAWFNRQFWRRAYPTRTATILLLLAILLAGAAATVALLDRGRTQPALAIVQTETATTAAATSDGGRGVTLTVDVAFRALAANDVAIVIVTVTTPDSHAVIGRAAITPGTDGTVTRSITVRDVPRNGTIDINATGGHRWCRGRLDLTHEIPITTRCGEVS